MLFDSTLRKELSRSFGATLVVLLTIVLTLMLVRTLGLAAAGSVSPQDVVLLLSYTALGQLPTILSLSLFVAVVVTINRMYRDSEMVIWFASGVGLQGVVPPLLRAAWPVLLMVALLQFFVWPWGNRNSSELRNQYQARSDLSRVTPGVFQSSADGKRVFFIERDAATESAIGRNVFVLNQKDQDEAVTTANRGFLQTEGVDRFLVLEQGQRNDTRGATGEHTVARFERYSVLVDDRSLRRAEELPPKAMHTKDLIRNPTARNQGELTWRLGMLLGAANLALLAVGVAASNPRRPSNWNLVFALLAFVTYFNLINLSQAWVGSGRQALWPTMLVLHGGMFLLAWCLILYRERAAVWRLWPARRVAA
jgi:lipopolysaccharide export system permease protein